MMDAVKKGVKVRAEAMGEAFMQGTIDNTTELTESLQE